MQNRISILVLVAAAVALNVAIGSAIHLLKLPIYLDSMGIMVVALLAPGSRGKAFVLASTVGIISFILGGILVNPFLPWFSLTAVAGAAYGALVVRGRVDSEISGKASTLSFVSKALVFGIGWGIISAIMSAPVVVYLFGGVTGSGTTLVTAFLLRTGHQLLNAALLTGFAAEPVDKTLQMIIALMVARATPQAFITKM